MIDKANGIYDRWLAGYELPTVVLGASDDECDSTNGGTNTGSLHVDPFGQHCAQSEPDPFARFHPRLVQCVAEIHQRAKSLSTSRKSCRPPTWGPTPVIHSPSSPVLPPEVPQIARMSYSQNGHHGNGYNGMSTASTSTSTQSYSSSDVDIQTSYGGSAPDQGGMFYSSNSNSVPGSTPTPQWAPSTLMALSSTSKMAIVDTINFELGALNSTNDQSWMAFF